jgi:cobalt-zinc-cadmium efflux system membrane fusion protein
MPRNIVLIVTVFLAAGLALFAVGCGQDDAAGLNGPAGEVVEHEEHEGLDGHEGEKTVQLDGDALEEFGIEVGIAGPGRLRIHVSLPGEVVVNPDRLAHVVPRVPGIVREVRKYLGENVHAGEVMAVLESRELADVKSTYLAAKERLILAETNFRREEDLWKKKISAEQDYLEARQALAEVNIHLRSAEQKLHALGFPEAYLAQLPDHPDSSYTRFEIVAPFSGSVIGKHITLGERLNDGAEAFVVADLSKVWVTLSVYQKDLPFVQVNQDVVIAARDGAPEARGTISYISPLVGEATRTATARVVLANPDGQWRPGLFVTALVATDSIDVPLLVPKSALETIDNQTCVFIKTADGFAPRPVTLGKVNDVQVEVLSGLEPGQQYVTRGGFTLKSELEKEAFGGDHGH